MSKLTLPVIALLAAESSVKPESPEFLQFIHAAGVTLTQHGILTPNMDWLRTKNYKDCQYIGTYSLVCVRTNKHTQFVHSTVVRTTTVRITTVCITFLYAVSMMQIYLK